MYVIDLLVLRLINANFADLHVLGIVYALCYMTITCFFLCLYTCILDIASLHLRGSKDNKEHKKQFFSDLCNMELDTYYREQNQKSLIRYTS